MKTNSYVNEQREYGTFVVLEIFPIKHILPSIDFHLDYCMYIFLG